MTHPRTTVLFALLIIGMAAGAVALAAQGRVTARPGAVADKIECPVDRLEWGFDRSFPDPWYAETFVETRATTPSSLLWQGKEMIRCWYHDTEPWPDPYPEVSPTAGHAPGRLYVVRPALDIPEESYPCPPTLTVRVLTPLPEPWLGSTYRWRLVSKGRTATITAILACEYEGETANFIVRPVRTDYPDVTVNPPKPVDDFAQGQGTDPVPGRRVAVGGAGSDAAARRTATGDPLAGYNFRVEVGGTPIGAFDEMESGTTGEGALVITLTRGAFHPEVGSPRRAIGRGATVVITGSTRGARCRWTARGVATGSVRNERTTDRARLTLRVASLEGGC